MPKELELSDDEEFD